MERHSGRWQESLDILPIPIVLGLYVGLPFSIGYAVARWWVVGAVGVAAAVVVILDTADWVRVAPIYDCWYALCAGIGVALRTGQVTGRTAHAPETDA